MSSQPYFPGARPLSQPIPRFTGHATHSLDGKGRLVVPVRFRALLGEKFVMTVALGAGCLALYPAATWAANQELLDAEPLKDERYWAVLRKISRYTIEDVECDGQGRLLIPAGLREKAGIERDVVTVGMNRRLDVWAKERFDDDGPSDKDVAAYLAPRGLF